MKGDPTLAIAPGTHRARCVRRNGLRDPKDNDKQYNPVEWIPAHPDDKPPVYGTYYISMWCGQGQKKKGPDLSSDFRISGVKMNAAGVFITPLHQTIGLIFEAVNRQAYHNYLRNVSDRSEAKSLSGSTAAVSPQLTTTP